MLSYDSYPILFYPIPHTYIPPFGRTFMLLYFFFFFFFPFYFICAYVMILSVRCTQNTVLFGVQFISFHLVFAFVFVSRLVFVFPFSVSFPPLFIRGGGFSECLKKRFKKKEKKKKRGKGFCHSHTGVVGPRGYFFFSFSSKYSYLTLHIFIF